MNRIREQGGFGLIEVIVSAAVLALASLAILAGIEGAQSSAGREKARSIASSLAERDQERLRSLQFDTLDAYSTSPPPATQTIVDGVPYTVTSTTTWQTDSTSGTDQCTSSSSNAKYLQLTSVVTSKLVGKNIGAVRMDSLEAPSVQYSANHGDLGVKVIDRNGAGVPNIAVSIAGPESGAATTDATGCAFFGGITIGTYTASLNTLGYVDQMGNTASQLPGVQVAAGSVTVKSIAYDQAGSVTATFKTYSPSATTAANAIQSGSPTLTAANGTVVGLMRTYPAAPGTVGLGSITADKLFPFTTAYAFYSGLCGYDNPQTLGTATPASLIAQPNQSLAVDVMQPPLLVNVLKDANGGSVSVGEEKVTATPVAPNGDTCSDQKITDLTTQSWVASDGAPAPNDGHVPKTYTKPADNGWLGRSVQKVGGKNVPDAGLPFGQYQLCFADTSKGSTYHWTWSGTYDNTKPYPGTTGTDSNINAPLELTPSGVTKGACP
jgi:type II secretory pathway pseudopilin PulG